MKKLICFLLLASLACSSSAAVSALPLATSTSKAPSYSTASAPTVTRALCGNANIRKSPAPDGPSLGVLLAGASVTVYEYKYGWGRVGVGRWVIASVFC